MDALAQAEKRADSSVQLGADLETRTLELARSNDELHRFKKAVHVSCVHVHLPFHFPSVVSLFVARLRHSLCRGYLCYPVFGSYLFPFRCSFCCVAFTTEQ